MIRRSFPQDIRCMPRSEAFVLLVVSLAVFSVRETQADTCVAKPGSGICSSICDGLSQADCKISPSCSWVALLEDNSSYVFSALSAEAARIVRLTPNYTEAGCKCFGGFASTNGGSAYGYLSDWWKCDYGAKEACEARQTFYSCMVLGDHVEQFRDSVSSSSGAVCGWFDPKECGTYGSGQIHSVGEISSLVHARWGQVFGCDTEDKCAGVSGKWCDDCTAEQLVDKDLLNPHVLAPMPSASGKTYTGKCGLCGGQGKSLCSKLHGCDWTISEGGLCKNASYRIFPAHLVFVIVLLCLLLLGADTLQ